MTQGLEWDSNPSMCFSLPCGVLMTYSTWVTTLTDHPAAMMPGGGRHQVSHGGKVFGQGCPSWSSPIGLVCCGGNSGTPGVRVQLDSPLVIRVVVADPQDLCSYSCGVLRAGSSNPSEQRALKASTLFTTVPFQLLHLLLIWSIGSTGSIPPLLLASAPLLCLSVAILLIQDVQQCVPLLHQLCVWKFLQVLLPGLKQEESLEFFYPH